MIAYLLQGMLLGGSAAAQPGPFQAYLLSETLKNGWRRTVPAAAAPLVSDGLIILTVLLILTQTPSWFLNALQLAGGLFLLYLAWQALHSLPSAETDAPTPPPPDTTHPGLGKAAIMNLLNPNPWIFWSTIAGPILIKAWREQPLEGLTFLVGFYAALCGGLLALIVLFGLTQKLDPRLGRGLGIVSAVALALFGIYQLWQGVQAVLPLVAS